MVPCGARSAPLGSSAVMGDDEPQAATAGRHRADRRPSRQKLMLVAAPIIALIVCTNVGGNPELVTDRESGLHVECGDVTGLAKAISELLTGPRLAQRLATNAHRQAAARDTSSVMLAAYTRLYDGLAVPMTPTVN